MFKTIVSPLVGDTDALGHINNNVLGLWFELARNDIFKIFNPNLEVILNNWPLIILKTEYEYVNQMFYGKDVEIRTYVLKIGNSSFTTYHEAWQNGKLCGKGRVLMVHFDYNNQKSVTIPDNIRLELEKHLVDLD
ncbi:thioesterase family protein [uncultured Methanobrevibacter sp.]|uniref:acyl-CoA thioesterase n=1 Tax=uncultured Methanobrevibacter sp. TaxID=253161 RepID=UPI0025DB6F81|nr:thioesterase family protein [uncultured Methanobrevibacter sp.]